MYLSEAIKRRENILKRAQAMETWANSPEVRKGYEWHEMRKAVSKAIDDTYEEWHKYNDIIEKDIQQLQIEIN